MKPSPPALALIVFALSWFIISPATSPAALVEPEYRRSSTLVQQVIQSELVVVGTVTALEPEIHKLPQQSGGNKVNYMVAVVKVDEALLGVKGLTHIRIGFVPVANMDLDDEEDIQFGAYIPIRNNNLREGQQACFLLKKHHQGDFYTYPSRGGGPLFKNARHFEDDLNQVKKTLKVLQNPLAALQASEPVDRQFAACVLVNRCGPRQQQPRGSATSLKFEPIPAEESKLILSALSEMLWGDNGLDRHNTLNLQTCFWQLGLTQKDDWRVPQVKNGDDYNTVMGDAVKKWLDENKGKYRIQRRVTETKTPMQ
jgi:hypothetical protein